MTLTCQIRRISFNENAVVPLFVSDFDTFCSFAELNAVHFYQI